MAPTPRTEPLREAPTLDALFADLGPALPSRDELAWLRRVRAELGRDPEDARAQWLIHSPRFARVCADVGISPGEARQRLLASVRQGAETMSDRDTSGNDRPGSGRRSAGRRALELLGLVALIAAAAAAVALLPTGEWLAAFLDWSRGLGGWALVLFVPVYVVATVLFVPGLILTLGAGFLFGLVKGTIVVSIGSTLGVAAAFLVGRYLARRRIEAALAGRPKFGAIDEAVGRQGFKIVLLTRLSPVFPFNLLNYAYGVTRVRFRDYVLASWIGMLPGTIMYVYFGTIAGSLAEILAGEAGPNRVQRFAILAVGLVIAVGVTVLVTRTARRALREAIDGEEAP